MRAGSAANSRCSLKVRRSAFVRAGRAGTVGAGGGAVRGGAAPFGALSLACIHPVAETARVFAQQPVALERDRLRDDVVQERAVVAHEEQRAGKVLQQRLEQFERVDVEVVGGFVQHQHVRGLREQPGEQKAIALPAGQRGNRRASAFRREQKVAEVGDHMRAPAADFDELGAGVDRVDQGGPRVELFAQLVVVRDTEVRAAAHRAPVRFDFAQDQLQQRALARPVGSDEADPVATDHARRKVADDRPRAEVLADVNEFGHQLARPVAGVQLQVHPAETVAARRAFAAQRLEPQHAALVARPARLDALADPRLLLHEKLVGFGVDDGLVLEESRLALLIRGEIARKRQEAAAVELDDARGHGVEETAVVRDAHDGAFEVQQQLLEPRDGGEIQVIGRLVQK